jgi:hypothetical protein
MFPAPRCRRHTRSTCALQRRNRRCSTSDSWLWLAASRLLLLLLLVVVVVGSGCRASAAVCSQGVRCPLDTRKRSFSPPSGGTVFVHPLREKLFEHRVLEVECKRLLS